MKKVFVLFALIATMMISFSCRDNKKVEEAVEVETVDSLTVVSPDSLEVVE